MTLDQIIHALSYVVAIAAGFGASWLVSEIFRDDE